jgi:hypothetical protein
MSHLWFPLANPLDLLSPEEIKKITNETVASAFSAIHHEFEKLMEEQKNKFSAQLAKLVGK